jgi:predicted NBD/HSP70 family sugar kinase
MIIAVDTGATKTLVTAFTKDKKSSKKYRFLTPKNPEEYVQVLTSLLAEHFELKHAAAISIAAPGSIKNQQIAYCWNLPWQNFDLIAALRKNLDLTIPILLQNDANLAGLAEIHTLPTLPDIGLYVTVSTGVGTGIITNGYIDPMMQRSEGGQMVLEFDGILREWEKFASGRAIYETYGKYAHDIHDDHTWEVIADKISRGLIVLTPLISPDIIVIGGSIGTHFPRYHKVLESLIKERISSGFKMPLLRQAVHPQEAVLYGCNIYANQVIT